MHFTNAVVVAGAAVASAKQTFRVDVGQSGLTYSPNNTIAQVGDDIEFHYFPLNHTVTQSSFAKPCVPLDGGFFSGFVPTSSDAAGKSTFTITVKDTTPIWFYCSQTKPASHCQKGMVGAINAKSTGNTIDAFAALAAKTNQTLAPAGGAVGGVLNLAGGSSTTSASGTGASTTVASGTSGAASTTASATKTGAPPAGNAAGKIGASVLAIVAAAALL